MNNYSLDIAYIFPDILNGEAATLEVLRYRLEQRDIKTNIIKINTTDKIPQSDIYFFTGGSDKSIKNACKLLNRHKSFLKNEAEAQKIIIGTDGGFPILTNYIEDKNGEKTEALGIINGYSKQTQERFSGNVVAKLKISEEINNTYDKILGFENHSINVYLDKSTKPLAKIIQGNGNNGKDGSEGAVYKNTFATWLKGPILANNPYFADYIIKKALTVKYQNEIILKELDNTEELAVYKKLLIKKY